METATLEDVARLEGKVDKMNLTLGQIVDAMGLSGKKKKSLNDIEQQAMADVFQFRKKRASKNDGKTG